MDIQRCAVAVTVLFSILPTLTGVCALVVLWCCVAECGLLEVSYWAQ